LILAGISFFTSLTPFLIDREPLQNSFRKSIWAHSINLTLFTIALMVPQNELSFIFIWAFISVLIVSIDPWIIHFRYRWLFPTYLLLAFGVYSLRNGLKPRESLEIEVNQSEVNILVTDSGLGISAEIVDKMMNPFFTTKEIGKGTGLGLSISKGIIEEHGGKLIYNSDSPNTQFIVKLPIYSQ